MKLSKIEAAKKSIAILVALGLLFPAPAYSLSPTVTREGAGPALNTIERDLLATAGVRSELRSVDLAGTPSNQPTGEWTVRNSQEYPLLVLPNPTGENYPDLSDIPNQAILALDEATFQDEHGETKMVVGGGDSAAVDRVTTEVYRNRLDETGRRRKEKYVQPTGEGLKDFEGQTVGQQREVMILKNEGFGWIEAEPRAIFQIGTDPYDGSGNASKFATGKEGRGGSLLVVGRHVIPVPDRMRAFALVYNDGGKGVHFDFSRVALSPDPAEREKEIASGKIALEEALADHAKRLADALQIPVSNLNLPLMGNETFPLEPSKRKPHRHLKLYDSMKATDVQVSNIYKSGTITPMVLAASKPGYFHAEIAGATETFTVAQALASLAPLDVRVYVMLVSENGFSNVKKVEDPKEGIVYEVVGEKRTRNDMDNLLALGLKDIQALREEKNLTTRKPFYSDDAIWGIRKGQHIWSTDITDPQDPGYLSPVNLYFTLHLPTFYEFPVNDGSGLVIRDEGIKSDADGSKTLNTLVIDHRGLFIRQQTFARSEIRASFKDLGGHRGTDWWNAMEPERRALLIRFLGETGTEPVNTIPFDHHKPKDHYYHPELSAAENMLLIAQNMSGYVDKYLIHPGYLLGRKHRTTGNFVDLRTLAKQDPSIVLNEYSAIVLHPDLPQDKLYVLKWEAESTPNGAAGETNRIGNRPRNQGEELNITAQELAGIPQVTGLKFMTYVDASVPESFKAIVNEVVEQSKVAHEAGLLFFPEDLPAKTVNGADYFDAFESTTVMKDGREERAHTEPGKLQKAEWEARNPLSFVKALAEGNVDFDAYKYTFPGNPALMTEEEVRGNLRILKSYTEGRLVMMLSGGDAGQLVQKARLSAQELNFVGNFAGRGVWQKSFKSVAAALPDDPAAVTSTKDQIARNLRGGDARKQYDALNSVKLQRPWWEYLGLTREQVFAGRSEVRAIFRDLGGLRGKKWWNAMEPERRARLIGFLGETGTEPVNTIPFDHHKPADHYGHGEFTPAQAMLLIANNMSGYVNKYLIHPGYLLGRRKIDSATGEYTGEFVDLKTLAEKSRKEVSKEYGPIVLHPQLPQDKSYVLKWEAESTPNGAKGEPNRIGNRPKNQGEELGITPQDLAEVKQVIGLKFMTYVDASQTESFKPIAHEVVRQSILAHAAGLLFFPEDLPAKTVGGQDYLDAFESTVEQKDGQEKKVPTQKGRVQKAEWEAQNPLLFVKALSDAKVDYDAYKYTFPGNPSVMKEQQIRRNLKRLNKHAKGRFVMMLSGGDAGQLVQKARLSADELNFVGNFAGRGVWQKSFMSEPSAITAENPKPDTEEIAKVSEKIAANLRGDENRSLQSGDAKQQYDSLNSVKLRQPWWEYLGLTREEALAARAEARAVEPAKVDLDNLAPPSVARLYDPITRANSFALDGFPKLVAGRSWQESLKEIIETQGALDMTTNQTLLRQLVQSGALDARIGELANEGRNAEETYNILYTEAATEAARIFSSIHHQWPAEGRVSQEASALITDLDPLVNAVKVISQGFTRGGGFTKVPNLGSQLGGFTKVPNLPVGPEAVRQATAAGVNVNVTLVFSIQHYLDTVAGYVDGLTDRVGNLTKEIRNRDRGLSDALIRSMVAEDISRIFSVNSLFVSRTDRLVDKLIDDRIAAATDESEKQALRVLKGKTGVAVAKVTYDVFSAVFLEDAAAFERLSQASLFANQEGRIILSRIRDLRAAFSNLKDFFGANPQRLLIASTGVKADQPYHPLLYVLPFLGPYVHNTLPQDTLKALSDFVATLSVSQAAQLRSRSIITEGIPSVEQNEGTKNSWLDDLLMPIASIPSVSPYEVLWQVQEVVLEPLGKSLSGIGDELRDAGAKAFEQDEKATLDVIRQRIPAARAEARETAIAQIREHIANAIEILKRSAEGHSQLERLERIIVESGLNAEVSNVGLLGSASRELGDMIFFRHSLALPFEVEERYRSNLSQASFLLSKYSVALRAEARAEWSEEEPITPETELRLGDYVDARYVSSIGEHATGVISEIMDDGRIILSHGLLGRQAGSFTRKNLSNGWYQRPLKDLIEVPLKIGTQFTVGERTIEVKKVTPKSIFLQVVNRSEARGMLVLQRGKDESIMIGDNIVITIVEVRGDKVRIGIDAPKEIPVHRQEVYDVIQRTQREEELRNKQRGDEGPVNRAESRFDGVAAELPDVLTPEQKTEFRGILLSTLAFYRTEEGRSEAKQIIGELGVTEASTGVVLDSTLLLPEGFLTFAIAVREFFGKTAPIAVVAPQDPIIDAHLEEINALFEQEGMDPFIVTRSVGAAEYVLKDEWRMKEIKGIVSQNSIVAEEILRKLGESQIITQQKLQDLIAKHSALAGLATQLQHYFALVQSA